MNKIVTALAAVACIIAAVFTVPALAGILGTFLTGTSVLIAIVAFLNIARVRRGFLLSSLVVLLGIAPFAFSQGHAWIAGIMAYAGLTMLFLAWNHAVHSLNRASDERQNGWAPASEQR
ncbi:MAG TPA: hypothetical protein VL500_01630 [Candidatus Eisenbacteria bacterium]|jgi:hypothetical protein|nr:hypothetical protein [Candidatus Eisenbacteria bacterium]